MFTVVIPAFNSGRYIRRSVQSVLGQSWHDFELIVVDDGSTDDTASVLAQFSDPRLRILRVPNGGVAQARNRGITAGTRRWVCFLDADDKWYPCFLSTVAALIERFPDDQVFATGYRKVDGDGRPLPVHRFGDGNSASVRSLRNLPFYYFRNIHPVHCNTLVVARPLGDLVGWFPEGLVASEDLLFILELTHGRVLRYCDLDCADYFIHGAPEKLGRLFRSPDPYRYLRSMLEHSRCGGDLISRFWLRLWVAKCLRGIVAETKQFAPERLEELRRIVSRFLWLRWAGRAFGL